MNKTKASLTLLELVIPAGLCLSASFAQAQFVVEDPTAITQDAVNQTVNVAKYVKMIDNQVEQINTLNQQLQQISAYTKAFGDPAQTLNISGVKGLVESLDNKGVNLSLNDLRAQSSGAGALQYNAGGLFSSVGSTSLSGVTVARPDSSYRKFDAINRATQNYDAVYDDVASRRQALKSQMAATTTRIQSATTDAETQKLTGVLIGQSADLSATDHEADLATSKSLMQDVENRNDEQRQAQAAAEELAADRHDAMTKMGKMLVPDIGNDLRFGQGN